MDWLDKFISKLRKTKSGDFYFQAVRSDRNIDLDIAKRIYDENPNASVETLLSMLKKEEKKKKARAKNKKHSDLCPTSIDGENEIKNGEPIMESNKDTITLQFYSDNGGELKDYNVSKKDICDAIFSILIDDIKFVSMDDTELNAYIRNNLDSLVDTYNEELCDIFCHDGASQLGIDSDDDLLSYTLEGISDDDPTFDECECYRNIYSEDWDEENVDEYMSDDRYRLVDKKMVYDYDGFTTDYCLYQDLEKDKYFTIFGDSDIYTPENSEPDAEFDDINSAEEWFENYHGFDDTDSYDDDFEECLHKKKSSVDWHKEKEELPYYDDDYEGLSESINKKILNESYKKNKRTFKYNDSPIMEGAMKEIDLEMQEDDKYAEKLYDNISALEKELDFLKNQAPREIRKGGAFSSQEEIDDAIAQTEKELLLDKAKYKVIRRRK